MGRLYGLKLSDIGDYPLWENVFRVSEGSSEHSGQYYYLGELDENGKSLGIDPIYTLPLVEGSHPDYDNIGPIKTGYNFQFELETIGNYDGDKDCISITPTFYYVQADGSNRQEVDLYYHQYFDGDMQYFVKIDENKNRDNTQYMQFSDIASNISQETITATTDILGISENTFMTQAAKLGWLDWVVLSKPLRTFVGNTENLPAGVDADAALTSVQHWYGSYYLPNDLYVAPAGYDIAGYSLTNGGLDGEEDFWLKEGYVIVNFEIQTVKDGDFSQPILSYTNGELASMWEIEGGQITKTDTNGVTFSIEPGDIVYYYTDEKASDDYGVSGTH
jgi:hypothetical protein